MIGDLSRVQKIYLVCGRTDMRKSFEGLMAIIRDNGKFQWPRNTSEVRPLTRQEFRWLMEGLSIDQPKAIQLVKGKDF